MRIKAERATREKVRKKKAAIVANVADVLEAAVEARAEVVVNVITAELVRESAGSLDLRKS